MARAALKAQGVSMPVSQRYQDAMGAAGLGAGIGSMFGQGDGFGDYEKYIGQGQGAISGGVNQATGYLNPYMDAGKEGIGYTQGMRDRFSDPDYYGNFAKNYQMSDAAHSKMHSAMDAIRESMERMGLSSSGAEKKAMAQSVQKIIDEDMQQQFQDQMQAAGMGMHEGDMLYGGGLSSATNAGRFSMQGAEDQASLDAALADAKSKSDQAKSSGWGGAIGGLIGGIGSLAGLL